MGISIVSNSGKKAYGIKHFIVDTANDINNLTTDCTPGSTALVIENSTTYILNTQHKWKETDIGGSGISDQDTLIFDGNNQSSDITLDGTD